MITLKDFLHVRRCSKAAYLNRNHPELSDKNMISFYNESTETQEVFEKLIQPNGARMSKFTSFIERDQKSREAIQKRGVIHMATFISKDNELVEINSLQRNERTTAWLLKTEPGEITGADIWSAGYKNYVLQKCGIKVDRFLIAFLNPEYVHNSDNKQPLFIYRNVTNKCKKKLKEVERYMLRLRKTLAYEKAPGVVIGYQCPEPRCIFHKHCWSEFTESSVFEFLDMSFPQKFRLYQNGFEKLTSVPDTTRLTAAEKMQLECHKKNKEYINKTEVKQFFDKLSKHTRFLYLDLNTTKSVLPTFTGSKPFTNIPYHYSVVKTTNGMRWEEKFTANPNGLYDVRLEFLKKIIRSLEPESSCPIMTWKAAYVRYYLKDCKRLFPAMTKDIERIDRRLISISNPFEERHFYHPKFSGRNDFWAVARVLSSEEFNQKLEVNNNHGAQMTYEKLKNSHDDEYKKLLKNLETYSAFKIRCLIKIQENLKMYL